MAQNAHVAPKSGVTDIYRMRTVGFVVSVFPV